jgi:purine-binding chemotaxis protein CheW
MSRDDPIDDLLALRRRASGEVENVDEPMIKLVIFRLGDGLWSLRGSEVGEILAQANIFFVPGCPDSIDGVINVRGDITSVMRLDNLLGLGRAEAGAKDAVLLCKAAGITTGIRVGEVLDVLDMPASSLLPPPINLADNLRHAVIGVFDFHAGNVTLVDLAPLLKRFREHL